MVCRRASNLQRREQLVLGLAGDGGFRLHVSCRNHLLGPRCHEEFGAASDGPRQGADHEGVISLHPCDRCYDICTQNAQIVETRNMELSATGLVSAPTTKALSRRIPATAATTSAPAVPKLLKSPKFELLRTRNSELPVTGLDRATRTKASSRCIPATALTTSAPKLPNPIWKQGIQTTRETVRKTGKIQRRSQSGKPLTGLVRAATTKALPSRIPATSAARNCRRSSVLPGPWTHSQTQTQT